MSGASGLARFPSLWDAPSTIQIAVLIAATLLPVLAVVGAVRARRSDKARRRRAAPVLALAAVALTYFHPLAQELMNELYLGPKLERARALVGQSLPQLLAELGEPSRVVPDPSPGPRSYGYVLYGSAPWTPLAARELLVPTSDDGKRVSAIAHYID